MMLLRIFSYNTNLVKYLNAISKHHQSSVAHQCCRAHVAGKEEAIDCSSIPRRTSSGFCGKCVKYLIVKEEGVNGK